MANNISTQSTQVTQQVGVKGKKSVLKKLFSNTAFLIGFTTVTVMVLACVFAPLLTSHGPNQTDVISRFQRPSEEHYLGTDRLGRDTFARILYGGRISVLFGVCAVLVGSSVGITLGILSGFFRTLDEVIMRGVDVLMAFPSILLAMAIVGSLGPSLVNAIIAIGVAQIPGYVRVTRASVLSLREQPFVEAARALGSRDGAIMRKHVFPNTIPTVIVYCTLQLSTAILAGSILSFLGLGVQPPTAEWGAMVSEARRYLRLDPFAAVWPIAALFLTILGFNFLGDGVRDVLDPKLER